MAIATTKHAVLNKDALGGTQDETLLVHGKYFSNPTTPAEIDNANIVAIGERIDGERELRVLTTPTATTPLKNIGIVGTPELIYDESRHYNLWDFCNEADAAVNVYRLHSNDQFSATAEAFESVPNVGDYAVVGASTKIGVSSIETGTVIGKIWEKYRMGGAEYYAVQVTL